MVPDPLRQLLTPRWIGFTLLALAVVGAFGVLSHWQWDRAHRDEASAAAASAPAPVPLVQLAPGTTPVEPAAYGRAVTVSGRYDAASQRLVPRGSTYFVIVALRPDGGGPAVPVVRGTAVQGPVPAPPAGPVTVTGWLQPYDGDPGVQPSDADLPAGQLARIARSALGPVMGPELSGGWLALTAQVPAAPALPVIVPSYGPVVHGGLLWQNATYAIQWLVFAGFVVFLWVRWFRDDLAGGDRDPESELDGDPGAGLGVDAGAVTDPGTDTPRSGVRSAT